jgi:hypothetical protein
LFELEKRNPSIELKYLKDIVRHQSIWAQLIFKLLQIIICRQRGCETLWVGHCLFQGGGGTWILNIGWEGGVWPEAEKK